MSTEALDPVSGNEYLFVKGAPELLLETSDVIDGGPSKGSVLATLANWQSKGMRTLGFAFRNMSAETSRSEPILCSESTATRHFRSETCARF